MSMRRRYAGLWVLEDKRKTLITDELGFSPLSAVPLQMITSPCCLMIWMNNEFAHVKNKCQSRNNSWMKMMKTVEREMNSGSLWVERVIDEGRQIYSRLLIQPNVCPYVLKWFAWQNDVTEYLILCQYQDSSSSGADQSFPKNKVAGQNDSRLCICLVICWHTRIHQFRNGKWSQLV